MDTLHLPLPTGMDDETATALAEMLSRGYTPERLRRAAAANHGWNLPVICVAAAASKTARVSTIDTNAVMLHGSAPEVAEELIESAHYLLRAAGLLLAATATATDADKSDACRP